MDKASSKGDRVKTVLNAVQEPEDEIAEGAEGAENADPAETMARLEEEAKANYDRFLRVSAEFENYKKRSAREIEDFRKYANESLLKDLLPVIDNLERALSSMEADSAGTSTLGEGVKLTHKDILKVLERYGATPVEAMGAEFDPCRHQALMMDESGQHPPNTVVKELQKGYMLKDRLLRPALVAVSAVTAPKGQCEEAVNDPAD